MKKLCAFILVITAAVSVFACQPIICTNDDLPAVTSAVITTAEPAFENPDRIITYIGNKNTKKFHLPSCYTLPKEKNRVYISSRQRAISRNFSPCKNCRS